MCAAEITTRFRKVLYIRHGRVVSSISDWSFLLFKKTRIFSKEKKNKDIYMKWKTNRISDNMFVVSMLSPPFTVYWKWIAIGEKPKDTVAVLTFIIIVHVDGNVTYLYLTSIVATPLLLKVALHIIIIIFQYCKHSIV